MKKLISVLLMLILCLSFVAGCSNEEKSTKDAANLDGTVLTKIGDYEVTQALYNYNYYMVYLDYAQGYQFAGADWINQDIGGVKVADQIKTEAKNRVETLVVAAKLAEEKFGITEKDVKESVDMQIDELVKTMGSKEELKNRLAELKTTEKGFRAFAEMYEIYGLLAQRMGEEGGECYVPEEEVKAQFDTAYAGKLRVQHILVSTKGDGATTPQRSDEEAMTIVNEVLGKLAEGAEFDKLITEYDEDPGMEPGQYYVFGDNEMVPEFEAASKALKVGEYTKEAVKTDYGYHIIKRYALDSTTEEYSGVKLSLQEEKLLAILDEEEEKSEIKWDDKALDTFIETWLEELNQG